MGEEFEASPSIDIRKAVFIYIIINTVCAFILYRLLNDATQTIAATVFFALVIGTLLFWKFRVAIAFIGIVILLLTKTIDLKHTVEFMSLDVILFLIGMMIIVGLLRRSGFFRWFLAWGLKISKFEPWRMLIIFIIIAAVMAALVDEVTSILFTTALVLDFSSFFKVKPIRLTMVVVLATNIGSSWTVLGNPIGILIALRSGLTFEDFLRYSFPIGVISLISIIILALLWMKRDLVYFKARIQEASEDQLDSFLKELGTVEDKKLFLGSTIIFFAVIVSLALHHRLELFMGLELNTMLVGTSILGAGLVMLWRRNIARDLLMKGVDWWTLVFFMFLFAKAGCLKYVGLTDIIAKSLFNLSGGDNIPLLIVIILWLSGFTSAAADNVVVVSTFIPVLQFLSQQIDSPLLWWALLFGGCYGGNMTMVGSTANIIALGILEDKRGYHMTLRYWLKIGFLGAIIPMLIGTVGLILYHFLSY